MSPPKSLMGILVIVLLLGFSFTNLISITSPSVNAAVAAPTGVSFFPAGIWPQHRELAYPLLCGSEGALWFAVKPLSASIRWCGVAIEVPREFGGLTDGITLNIRSTITSNSTNIKVIDEAKYHPYNVSAPFWVEIGNSTGFSDIRYIVIEGLKAPSVAGLYAFKCYYSTVFPKPTAFDYTSSLPIKAENKPIANYYLLQVPVSMTVEYAAISGRAFDRTIANTTGNPVLVRGLVTAVKDGKTWAKGWVNSTTSTYRLVGLAPGTYTIIASAGYWSETNAAYHPTKAGTITVAAGENRTFDITLPRGRSVNGTINWSAPSFGRQFTVDLINQDGTLIGSCRGTALGGSKDEVKLWETLDIDSGFPNGTYSVKVWAYGYVQKTESKVTITNGVASKDFNVSMAVGGLISGEITYSGGNPTVGRTVLAEAYDEKDILRGVYIGTTTGTDKDSFRIRGLSESEGEAGGTILSTYSGRGLKDYGLAAGNYKLKVYISGYTSPTSSTITLSEGKTTTVSMQLTKGGSISGYIFSKDAYGNNAMFTSPSSPLQVYIYDSAGNPAGYSATIQPSPTAQNTTYGPIDGFPWETISPAYIKMGYHNKALSPGNYTIKVYTRGYIQKSFPTVQITGTATKQVNLTVTTGGTIRGSVVFRLMDQSTQTLRAFIRLEAYDSTGAIRGATSNATATLSSSILFTITGFTNHIHPNGTQLKDYGLHDGTYTIKVRVDPVDITGLTDNTIPPILVQFIVTSVNATIANGNTVTVSPIAYQRALGYGIVRGYTVAYAAVSKPLSWVYVTVQNSDVPGTYSLDGKYYVGTLTGSYIFTYRCPRYQNYTLTVGVPLVTYLPISEVVMTSGQQYLIVDMTVAPNPLYEAAGNLTATFKAYVIASDGSTPSGVTYSWKSSGGSLNSTTSSTVKWTAPYVWAITAHTVTCTASLTGYTSGTHTEEIIVHPIPEFSCGVTTTLGAALIVVFLLMLESRRFLAKTAARNS